MTDKYPKEVYQEKMRAFLDEMRAELDAIEERVEQDGVELQLSQPERRIEIAHDIDDKAHDQLRAIENNDITSWEQFRTRLEHAWDNLIGAINQLEENVVTREDEASS